MKKNRAYEHHFDWEEAKRLRAEGVPITWIAQKLGVTDGAIRRIVIPGEMERMAQYSREYAIGQGRCERCGATTNKAAQNRGSRLCKSCADDKRATTVRETELLCVKCRQWKPDEQFHNSVNFIRRRGRRNTCKACANKMREDYRKNTRVPCKGGCGRTVSPSDQRAQKKYLNLKTTPGYCPHCSPTKSDHQNFGRTSAEQQKILDGAARFREKFGEASDTAGTT